MIILTNWTGKDAIRLVISCELSLLFHSLDLNWLKDLPYTLSIPSLDCLVVHAGLVPGRPLEEQAPGDMHSMRNLVPEEEEPLTPGPGSFKATSSPLTGVAWASMWSDGPHVYFGHDAKRGLQQFPLATGLDTGCCYGQSLVRLIKMGVSHVDDAGVAFSQVASCLRWCCLRARSSRCRRTACTRSQRAATDCGDKI